MLLPKSQVEQSTDLHNYKHRIIVAGSRGWDDRMVFHELMVEYTNRFDEPILFISGAAPSGADRLIIQWCKKFKYPCLEMPADWDNLGRPAGFIRNTEMAKVASHLVAFYNGSSPGTKHMISQGVEYKLQIRLVKVRGN